MVGRDLHRGGAHAGGELPPGIVRNRLVAVGDQSSQGSLAVGGTNDKYRPPITGPSALVAAELHAILSV